MDHDDLLARELASPRSDLVTAVATARSAMARPVFTTTTVFTQGQDPLRAFANLGVLTRTNAATLLELPGRQGGSLFLSWQSEHDGVWHVGGLHHFTSKTWRRFESRLLAVGTDVSRVMLDREQFRDLAEAVQTLGEDVRVRKIAARSRSSRRSAVDTSYPTDDKPTPLEVLAEQSDEDKDVMTILAALRDGEAVHIRRQSGASIYRGDVGAFVRTLLPVVAKSVESSRRVLTGRTRKLGEPASDAVVLVMDETRFRGPADTQVVLDLLLTQSNTAVAVLHRNPYFHAVVTDLTDGSSFDVMITTPTQVHIYSDFSAQTQQLARVAEVLFESLGAARLVVSEPMAEATIEDITTSVT